MIYLKNQLYIVYQMPNSLKNVTCKKKVLVADYKLIPRAVNKELAEYYLLKLEKMR